MAEYLSSKQATQVRFLSRAREPEVGLPAPQWLQVGKKWESTVEHSGRVVPMLGRRSIGIVTRILRLHGRLA